LAPAGYLHLSPLPATNAERLRKGASGSRECAPDDGLRDEAIHPSFAAMDRFACARDDDGYGVDRRCNVPFRLEPEFLAS
jgi:hypothetical protein